jgi:hypothetical protein
MKQSQKRSGTFRVSGTLLMYLKSSSSWEGLNPMPPKKSTTAAAALADAFASLSVEGRPVTVRALRERAGVSTDAAAEWLRVNRPVRDVSPPPADVLSRVLEPLWSAAVAVARDEQEEATAADRDALVQAEAEALTELSASVARVAELEAEVARIRRDLASAETARDRQAALAAAAAKDADDARTATHTAELAAAEAQATARTLREVIDTLRRAGNDAPAGG